MTIPGYDAWKLSSRHDYETPFRSDDDVIVTYEYTYISEGEHYFMEHVETMSYDEWCKVESMSEEALAEYFAKDISAEFERKPGDEVKFTDLKMEAA